MPSKLFVIAGPDAESLSAWACGILVGAGATPASDGGCSGQAPVGWMSAEPWHAMNPSLATMPDGSDVPAARSVTSPVRLAVYRTVAFLPAELAPAAVTPNTAAAASAPSRAKATENRRPRR